MSNGQIIKSKGITISLNEPSGIVTVDKKAIKVNRIAAMPIIVL